MNKGTSLGSFYFENRWNLSARRSITLNDFVCIESTGGERPVAAGQSQKMRLDYCRRSVCPGPAAPGISPLEQKGAPCR